MPNDDGGAESKMVSACYEVRDLGSNGEPDGKENGNEMETGII